MSRIDNERQVLGKRGELIAAEYLRRHGYRVHETNFRCRFGELDIIASQGKVLAFVEVRTRQGNGYGTPEESVDGRKQHKLRQMAEAYLQDRYLRGAGPGDPPAAARARKESGAKPLRPVPCREGEVPVCRIDVVVVELTPTGVVARVELIQDAVRD